MGLVIRAHGSSPESRGRVSGPLVAMPARASHQASAVVCVFILIVSVATACRDESEAQESIVLHLYPSFGLPQDRTCWVGSVRSSNPRLIVIKGGANRSVREHSGSWAAGPRR